MINHDKSPSITLFISPSVYQKYIPKQLLVFSHIDYRTFEVFISFPICGSLFSLSRSVSPSIKVSEIKFSHSSLLREGNKMKESAPSWYSGSSRLLFMQIWSHPYLKRRSCKLWKCVKSAQQNIDILIATFTKSRFFLQQQFLPRNVKNSCVVNWLTDWSLLWLVSGTEVVNAAVTQENKIVFSSSSLRIAACSSNQFLIWPHNS